MGDSKGEKKIGQEFGEIRQAVDIDALNRFLKDNVPAISTPVEVKQFSFGQSNPTYILTDSSKKRYVLRKKPPGDLLSPTAHAVEREYRILKCINTHNESLDTSQYHGDHTLHPDSVPVPKVFCLCEDKEVVGTNFYIMEFVAGRIFTDVRMLEIPKADRKLCWLSALRTLAAMHRLNPNEIGLEGYGKPKDFYPRQLKALAHISNIQANTKDKDTGKPVGEIPGVKDLIGWFSQNLPEDENTICHGDYKIDNLIFHPTEPRIIGVLDWELSTLGHPLSDLGNLLQPFSLPCTNPKGVNDPEERERSYARGELFMPLGGLSDQVSPIPSKETLLKEYCQAAKRTYPIPSWTSCEAWAWFRLAVISQGIAARVAQKQASSAQAKVYATKFPQAAQAARTVIESNGKQPSAKL
ncbi:unnamed protein product [Sympodiomycopsis kandeliae]